MGGGNSSPPDLSCVVCICVPLCYEEVHGSPKVEPLGLGVSVGGILGCQSSSVWRGVACLIDELGPPGPPCDYRDVLKTVKSSEKILRSLRSESTLIKQLRRLLDRGCV